MAVVITELNNFQAQNLQKGVTMSEANQLSIEAVMAEGLKELLDAPPQSNEFDNEEESAFWRKRHRRRKGENEKPTPLQLRYKRQLRDGRLQQPRLLEEMSKLVAWTWLPGKDRKDCPPVVEFRDPRLMVMDRFPCEPDGLATQIGLTMYRTSIPKSGITSYGGPQSVEMFKDFSIRPHFRAGGLCLDSRNEEVFRAALALDHAMELVARGKKAPVSTFDPPPVLFGFPRHIMPIPEWRQPMQEAVLGKLHPNSPVLRCLLSPGGVVVDVADMDEEFRSINIEKSGAMIHIKVPKWVILSETTRKGSLTTEGQPLGDLPRATASKIQEINARYKFPTMDWLERRILDELTEFLTISEEVYDKQTGGRVPSQTTWRCLPSQYVQHQAGRAVRFLIDFRKHLGRTSHSIDAFERDQWSENPHHVRVDVCKFDAQPVVQDLVFSDTNGKHTTWHADLMTAPVEAAWASRIPMRGAVAA